MTEPPKPPPPQAGAKRRFAGDPATLPKPRASKTPLAKSQDRDKRMLREDIPLRRAATDGVDAYSAREMVQRDSVRSTKKIQSKPATRLSSRTLKKRKKRAQTREREAQFRPHVPRPRVRKKPGFIAAIFLAFMLPALRFLKQIGSGIAAIWRAAGRIDETLWQAISSVFRQIDGAVKACADLILAALSGFFAWLPTRSGRGYCAFFGLIATVSGLWIADEFRSAGLTAGAAEAAKASTAGFFSAKDPILARLDGDLIRLSDVTRSARLSGALSEIETLSPGDARTRDLLNDLIDQRLLARAAMESGMARTPEVAAQLTVARERLLAASYVQARVEEAVTPENVAALYQAQSDVTALGEEIKARHILVATREEAIQIIIKIDRGADFSTLARSRSLDRGTAPHGGDMGYITRDMVSDEFARAAFSVDEGALSLPFRTDEGWNIVQILDKRATDPVAFDSVEEDLARFLELRTINDTLNQLRETYDVVLAIPESASP